MTDVRAELAQRLEGMASPFLFVGAGLSRRYLEADDWEGLLRRFADYTDRPYDYYRASASGDLPLIASGIAERFHEIWWGDPRFADSVTRHGASITGPASTLKVEVSEYLSTLQLPARSGGVVAEELELMRQAVFDGIITTNFDGLLTSLYPHFRTFVGQDELLFSSPQGIGEIYMIHGSCGAPDSLVLTAEDYERFEDRNPYLAAKLMTIFVEQPVIFMGYGLQDRNVLSILRSIAGCLTPDGLERLTDRLIFIQWTDNCEPTIGPHTIMVDDFVIPVLRIEVPDFLDVFAALGDLKRRFPAGLLRRLKEQVYDLVLTDDPHSRLMVSDIEDDTEDDAIDVVFGVGINARLGHHGYVGLDRWNIVDDVLSDDEIYTPRIVLSQTLPKILRAHPNANIPVHKYLRAADALKRRGGIKASAEVDDRVRAMAAKAQAGLVASKAHARKADEVVVDTPDIDGLLAAHGIEGVLNFGHHLPHSARLARDLHEFLTAHRQLRTGPTSTQYMKLVCLYDWMRYGKQLT